MLRIHCPANGFEAFRVFDLELLLGTILAPCWRPLGEKRLQKRCSEKQRNSDTHFCEISDF